jgi:hypothetical protein
MTEVQVGKTNAKEKAKRESDALDGSGTLLSVLPSFFSSGG